MKDILSTRHPDAARDAAPMTLPFMEGFFVPPTNAIHDRTTKSLRNEKTRPTSERRLDSSAAAAAVF